MIAPLRNDALKLGLNKDEADDYVKQVLITMIGDGEYVDGVFAGYGATSRATKEGAGGD
ncbi:hypothetical protein RhiTH_010912 [Rhizoctonia solani]